MFPALKRKERIPLATDILLSERGNGISQGEAIPELTMLGGPLQRLGSRLGLVRGGTNTVRLGLLLGLFAWSVLITLALLQGFSPRILDLTAIGAHVRFLVAVPLFFVCEAWVTPHMAEFARDIVRSGVAPQASMPTLASAIRRVNRLSDSRLAEALFLVAALALPVAESFSTVPGTTGSWVAVIHSAGSNLTWMHAWYLGFCLPLFRFLAFRWLWRLGLWWYFLWRVGKLPLRLIPTHSDRVAGLGYLEIVHEQFAPLAFAISALFSALCAEVISPGIITFETLYSIIPLFALFTAAVFIGPLFVFYRKLWICRANGLSEYMIMASRYVTAFDSKWIRDPNSSGEVQLGTADLQSLADLTQSIDIVRDMRWVPVGNRLIMELACCVAAPLLPLLFLKYPVDEIASRLFRALTGL